MAENFALPVLYSLVLKCSCHLVNPNERRITNLHTYVHTYVAKMERMYPQATNSLVRITPPITSLHGQIKFADTLTLSTHLSHFSQKNNSSRPYAIYHNGGCKNNCLIYIRMYVCMLHAMTGAQNTTGLTTTNKPGLCPVCVCVCVCVLWHRRSKGYRPHPHSCPAPGQNKNKKSC